MLVAAGLPLTLKPAPGDRPMTHFRAALRFLTVLPAGRATGFDAVAMVPWFPVVGLVIGLLLAAADLLAGRWWGPNTVAVVDVLVLAVLSGALHLDGLADTADGLFSHRPREAKLAIMKDSRIGSMGVIALVAVLALKWCGLAEIEGNRDLLLLIVPAYARGGVLFAMRLLPYGRPERRHGARLLRPPARRRGVLGARGDRAPVARARAPGARSAAAFVLITAGLIAFYRRQLGCVTGDMLGAMIEVTEAGLLPRRGDRRRSMIGGHGGNIYELARRLGCTPADILDLSSNVNPLGPAARAARAPGRAPGRDRRPARGRQRRASSSATPPRLGLPADRVVAGNGTTQFIYSIPGGAEDPTGADRGPDLLGLRRQPAGCTA
ncbi:MAG: adenosylcobinamide-GDP ribazoletransferase [Desulfobacterales bacterium]|nr:adenosylcobinamide-GDP ribazoletransferase [Desulfobacterales bacterium]